MRAEDCKWAPSFQINDLPRVLSVRRPPVCGQHRGFFLEDDMRNTTTVALALGLALPLTLTYQAPAALITFEHHLTGSITGTLGGVPFSTTNIVLTGIGNLPPRYIKARR